MPSTTIHISEELLSQVESDLNKEELRQLQEAGERLEADILALRRNRKGAAV